MVKQKRRESLYNSLVIKSFTSIPATSAQSALYEHAVYSSISECLLGTDNPTKCTQSR
jgi:hypothetical protein